MGAKYKESTSYKLDYIIRQKFDFAESVYDALSLSALPCMSFITGAILTGYLEKGGDISNILKICGKFTAINTLLIYPINKLIGSLLNKRINEWQASEYTDEQFIEKAKHCTEYKGYGYACIINPISVIICGILHNDGGLRIISNGNINFDPPALIFLAGFALLSAYIGAVSFDIINHIRHCYDLYRYAKTHGEEIERTDYDNQCEQLQTLHPLELGVTQDQFETT